MLLKLVTLFFMQYTIVTEHEKMLIHAHNANPPLNFFKMIFCSSQIHFKWFKWFIANGSKKIFVELLEHFSLHMLTNSFTGGSSAFVKMSSESTA